MYRTQICVLRHYRLLMCTIALCMLMLAVPRAGLAAPAQEDGINEGPVPRSMRIQDQELEDADDGISADDGDQASGMPVRRIIIDTDPGVDDAVAIVALLSQQRYPVQVLGIATVNGNALATDAAENVLNILFALGRHDIPVATGTDTPQSRTLSRTGKLLHGPNGLWFLDIPERPSDSSPLIADAVDGLYCNQGPLHGVTLIALGPLTNIAEAIRTCEGNMRSLEAIVFLGGAKFGGNITPVAEYNVWQDPEAFEAVLEFVKAGTAPDGSQNPTLTIVPLDAFGQLTISQAEVDKLSRKANPAMTFLLPALQQYIAAQSVDGTAAGLPDPVAVAMALDPNRYGQSAPALIKVMTPADPSGPPSGLSFVRGMTIVGTTLTERISMLADDAELSMLADRAFSGDPNFNLLFELGLILSRGPDSAQFVTDINESRVARDLFRALTR